MPRRQEEPSIILNGTIALGSDDERRQLMEHIANIRQARTRHAEQLFEILRLCQALEESGLWRLYGTWTFARVLKEECGVQHADYKVYQQAREHIDHEAAQSVGLSGLREACRHLPSIDEQSAELLFTQVVRDFAAYRAEHGFSPTNKAALLLVRRVTDRMGISPATATSDGLRERYQWLVATLEQIESLADEGGAIQLLSRNALERVGAKEPTESPSRSRAESRA